MTKAVRIENADNGNSCGVKVQIWDKGGNGENGTPLPDTLAKEINLDYPTAITGSDVYLTDTRYIVITETKRP